ncbi:hypothetical protein BO82DRAFT_432814 [Aspergillus uvarum CBS 121591]|uniref:C2H2-type domain-containing protein n=1 Tax=Aspergillus uvarum CBS 121591 TaxID=1448315 RepID=A0A319CAS3_9EURO|nr:hypothetical protein BO82DRAFT_432814 [Aspergillus uvarum CBS 121591]PYH81179.1 hypothetical protein BO82DRAFT_432814 [Aspergillus uvarum CBS 121591]
MSLRLLIEDWLDPKQTFLSVLVGDLEDFVEELCLECAHPSKSKRLERLRHFQADLRALLAQWDWLVDRELARYFHRRLLQERYESLCGDLKVIRQCLAQKLTNSVWNRLYVYFNRFRNRLRYHGVMEVQNRLFQEALAGSYQEAANMVGLPNDNSVQLKWFLYAACEARYPRADPRLRVRISDLILARRRVITRQSSHLPRATVDFTRTIELPPIPGILPDKHFIRCPYCEHRFLSQNLSQSKWRRHLMEDLRPYLCMWALCPHTFSSIDAWLNHLKDAKAHPAKLLASFLNECPFCGFPCADYQWSSVEKLLRHIAERHLEELFLLALPGGPTDLFSNVFLKEEKISLEPYEALEAHEAYFMPFGSPQDDEVEESVDTEEDDGLTSEGVRSPRSLI